MQVTPRILLLFALAAAAAAQSPLTPEDPGELSGLVLDATTSRPMRRVQVILTPAEPESSPVAMITAEDGRFHFRDLPAERYSLTARKENYLPSTAAETGFGRLPRVFTVFAGQSLEGIVIRLHPAGVITGEVTFADGEPAIGVPVLLFSEYFYRGRHGFRRLASSFTDDRGEYRIYGLPAGRYFAMAAYTPPSFGSGVVEQEAQDIDGAQPVAGPVITYFRNTFKPLDAEPVPLRRGEQLPFTDITLARARAYALRGVVRRADGSVGGGTIRLRQPGPSAATELDAPAAIRVNPDSSFEISNVLPGQYSIVATSGGSEGSLTGRLVVTVGESDVEELVVLMTPNQELTGEVLMPDEDEEVDLSQVRVSLEPHSDAVSVSVATGTPFTLSYVSGEVYDLFVENLPPGTYVEHVRMGGFEIQPSDFQPAGGAMPKLLVELSTEAAIIQGIVSDGFDKVALGATVVLIPDPPYGRVQEYQATTTNQFGQYAFQGVAPGGYTVVSWWDEPLCEIYNLASVNDCLSQGVRVDVDQNETARLDLPVRQ